MQGESGKEDKGVMAGEIKGVKKPRRGLSMEKKRKKSVRGRVDEGE